MGDPRGAVIVTLPCHRSAVQLVVGPRRFADSLW